MIVENYDHCQIVTEAINGKREVNQQVLASATILSERLERLKKADKCFSGIELSGFVKRLAHKKVAVAVG